MGGAGRVIAGCFALCAFAVAVAAGLAAGNEPLSILGRAILAMIVCYPVGVAAGSICGAAVDRHVRAHRIANPLAVDAAPPGEIVKEMPGAAAEQPMMAR